MQVGLWDVVKIYNNKNEYITFVIGFRGLIFYASKFEKVDNTRDAIKILSKNGLHINKNYVLV